MAFAAFHLLAGVVAARIAMADRFHRLTIHHSGTWFGRLSCRNTGQFSHTRKYLIPDTAASPFQVIVVDVTIIRKVMRQHLPLAASLIKIEDRIDDLTTINCPRSSWACALGEEWRDPFPGFITDIGRIWLAMRLCAHAQLLSGSMFAFRMSSKFQTVQWRNF